jgi:hypothetical protein
MRVWWLAYTEEIRRLRLLRLLWVTSSVLGHPLASHLDSRFGEEVVIWLGSVQNECFDHEVVPQMSNTEEDLGHDQPSQCG